MSAGLEFHWPAKARTDDRRPSPEADPAPRVFDVDVPPDVDAPSDMDVAGEHSAECKRVLRSALDRIVDLEERLRTAQTALAETSSTVEVQRAHIDFLNTKLRERRKTRGRAPRR